MPRPTVAIGLLGTVLDGGQGPKRWERWRPTVALCQQEDLQIDRLHLLFARKYDALREVLCSDLRQVSPDTEVVCHPVEFADPWDFQDVYGGLLDWAKSQSFDADAEDYLIHITTGTHVAQICLFLLAESHHLPGRLLQTSPPAKWGTGPGEWRAIDLDLSKYDRLAARFEREQADDVSFLKQGIVTRNAGFNALIDRIERVAIKSAAPILLAGPTGAGKSRLARRIYDLKKRQRRLAGPFVEANCATLRGDAAMSALFGHTRGAFTGALAARPGLLKSADGGMLFLDEVGELGVDEQAMLLRALEEKRFLPVGSDREASSDFALIAGTNRELSAAVREGRFRDDLLARINLWTFALPALKDRPEDVEPNLDFELEQYARQTGDRVRFGAEARRAFLAFAASPAAAWAGNFRDLNAAVVRMATLAPGGRIAAETVRDEIERLRTSWTSTSDRGNADALLRPLLGARLDDVDSFDRAALAEVVGVCRRSASASAAGRELFAASRGRRKSTNDADRLRKYLARFGLDFAGL